MNTLHPLPALVTIAALALYFIMSVNVARARIRHGIPAPAMSGDPEFERIMRVQANTLEWLPIFLPLLWLNAVFVGDSLATYVGVVWIVGRLFYMVGYQAAAEKRNLGFAIQSLSCGVLLVGAIYGIVRALTA